MRSYGPLRPLLRRLVLTAAHMIGTSGLTNMNRKAGSRLRVWGVGLLGLGCGASGATCGLGFSV